MSNTQPLMRHIHCRRTFCAARVAMLAVATCDLLLLSSGLRVGPCWHLVGSFYRECSIGRIASAVTMCTRGELSNDRLAGKVLHMARAKSATDEAEVALTREAGKNAKLGLRLEQAGVSSVEIPCIRHQDGPDLPLLQGALENKNLAYVIITSPEAAKVFLSEWKGAGQPVVPVACVGKATGETLEKGGVTPIFTPTKSTGEILAAELPFPDEDAGAKRRPRVLYPASARAQNKVESGLAARGFQVRRLNTYDTVPAEWDVDAEVAAAVASVVAFGSPSAVKVWAERAGVARETNRKEEGDAGGAKDGGIRAGALAACIGETSAQACREAGWAESAIFYPEKPGMEGWVRSILDALAAKVSSGMIA